MSGESKGELKIEEFKEMQILGDCTSATIRFDETKIKDAKISFDDGKTWTKFVFAKQAIEAFVDRYADKLEL